jgi:UDP-2-acetamido-3-amino-2,3-dideoxy-glucuronate N-acetyltransferase
LSELPEIALVGCGYWGKNLCRNFNALGALSCVVDSTDSGQAMARKIAPEIPVGSSFEDALDNPSVRAVALATPAETHSGMAIRAMESGKDVFVEKPMALTLDDALRMKEVAVRAGRILMVGHLLEFHPAILQLRDLISNGTLGKVNYVYSNRLNFGKVRTEENALWSFAPHDVAVILRLMGKSPVEVSATGGSFITKGLADTTVSNLLFADESRAHIFVSWLHPFKEQRLVVVGDRKMAIFNDVAPFGQKLQLYLNSVDFEGEIPVLKKEDAQFVEHSQTEPLLEECRHFLECVASRKEPLTDASSGIEVLKVLHACQESMGKNGIPISL